MELSIIIPVYNSSLIVKSLIENIEKKLVFLKQEFEIILVNDFSTDNSWEEIVKISKNNKKIKGISLSKNYGQHNAIMAGLNECSGEYIILMDDDMQHDPIYIKKIYEQLRHDKDVCYVNYLNRQHAFWKRTVSWLNNVVSSFLMDKPFKIYTSSYKGIKKDIKNEIIKDKRNEVFLDLSIFESTKNVTIIDIEHKKRLSGKTNYSLKKLLILWSAMIINLKLNYKKISFIPLLILKLFIGKFLYKLIKNKNITEQYKISEKTF